MKCIIFGGSGEVGGAVARELIKSDVCSQLTMIGRRTVASMQNTDKVKQVMVDTNSSDFENIVKNIALGHDVAISCVGIGSGSSSMSEEQMLEVEVNMLGKYARGCKFAGVEIFELLTAVGVNETSASSRIKGFRVLGKKYKTVLDVGFKKLAVFKPGMIVGNVHTPQWLTFFTRFIPDFIGWGNIRKDEVAQAFVIHLEKKVVNQKDSVMSYGNKEMKLLLLERNEK